MKAVVVFDLYGTLVDTGETPKALSRFVTQNGRTVPAMTLTLQYESYAEYGEKLMRAGGIPGVPPESCQEMQQQLEEELQQDTSSTAGRDLPPPLCDHV